MDLNVSSPLEEYEEKERVVKELVRNEQPEAAVEAMQRVCTSFLVVCPWRCAMPLNFFLLNSLCKDTFLNDQDSMIFFCYIGDWRMIFKLHCLQE